MARQSVRLLQTTVDHADKSFSEAVRALRRGSLVSFPTETVYGLGGNALDGDAVSKIFRAKGRPSSDPLIVHVLSWQSVQDLGLVEESPETTTLLRMAEKLASAFWPGPLTLVLPASKAIPTSVTAGSGFVGVRSPSHPIARRLLEESGLPIAAPSANRFGHTSPTKAEHVATDLKDGPAGSDGVGEILILDGHGCDVGIESTVLRIGISRHLCTGESESPVILEVLRRGLVDGDSILNALREGGETKMPRLRVLARKARTHLDEAKRCPPSFRTEVSSGISPSDIEDTEALAAPGQLLTHYAPDIPAYILPSKKSPPETVAKENRPKLIIPRSTVVVIDFRAKLHDEHGLSQENGVLAYRDISSTGNISEASSRLFDALRWAETVADAKAIVLPDLSAEGDELMKSCDRQSARNASLCYAVYDRCFRATSGQALLLSDDKATLEGVITDASTPPILD